MKKILLTLVAGILALSAMAAQAQTFTSGKQRVNVLELYTSEGCSSCPPADRYFSSLKDDGRLWSELVPVAFHVDYWNYIGWPDRFSSERYSERQRNYARADNVSTVYTPGFVLNGEEWRSFFGLRRLSLDNETVGELEIMLNDDRFNGTFMPAEGTSENIIMNIAILGFGLETKVDTGENRGKILQHDFTVLGYKQVTMEQKGSHFSVSSQLPKISVNAPRTALAAWVNRLHEQAPLQATGGWINR